MHPLKIALTHTFWMLGFMGFLINAVALPDALTVGLPALAIVVGLVLVLRTYLLTRGDDPPARDLFSLSLYRR